MQFVYKLGTKLSSNAIIKLASSNNLHAGAPQFNGAVDRWS